MTDSGIDKANHDKISDESKASQFKKKLNNFSVTLPIAMLIVIFAASLIVGLGYIMYLNSDNQKYDLARPGQKQDNKALGIEDEADTTSPVDEASAKRKKEYLKKEIDALKGITNFEPTDLSDQNIQLAPAEQPSR